jgi:putative FmdB family regulatory protein
MEKKTYTKLDNEEICIMPMYVYSCSNCGHEFETLLPMSKMEEPLKKPCPNCGVVAVSQEPTTAFFTDPFNLGRIKPPSEFRDKLRRIKKAHPGSTMRVE